MQGDASQPSVPVHGACPMCGQERTWAEALLSERHMGWNGRRTGRVRPALKADPKLRCACHPTILAPAAHGAHDLAECVVAHDSALQAVSERRAGNMPVGILECQD